MLTSARPRLHALLLVGLLFGLLGPSLAAPGTVWAVSGKNLVLVGGGLQDTNAQIYDRIVALAGGRGVARIGIITAASIPESQDPNAGTSSASNARANGLFYANLFKTTYGAADAQWIPIDLDQVSNASSPAVVEQINSMTGFFFGGGDQSRLITCFFGPNRADTPALAAIRTRFAAGAVVAGTSAGSAIQAQAPMITGGESYEALRYGSFTAINPDYPDDLTYDAQGGFGLFRYGLLDTHFAERGRQGRIIRLASDTQKTMAYGIDENTALVVTNADTASVQMQVIGQGGVGIFDLAQATRGTGSPWSISGVKASYLTQDDRFNPATKTATIASWKSSLTGREYYSSAMRPTRDIFSSPTNRSAQGGRRNPREFIRVSTDLFDSRSSSTTGQTYETNPTFEARLTKSSAFGSTGYQGYLGGVNFYAYTNLRVDLYRY